MTRPGTTAVRNTSGVRKYFAFLGEHGVELDPGEDYPVAGDLFTRWQGDSLQTAALQYALDNALLVVLYTPDRYVADPTAEVSWVLAADAGAVALRDPDTGSYAGGGGPDPGFTPGLDFSDARNSMYSGSIV